MKKIVLVCGVLLCVAQAAKGQGDRYLIQLKDKARNAYAPDKPHQFLSPRSIARRTRHAIPYDSSDLPVTPAYIDSIRAVPGVTVLNVSKWLNLVSVQTGDTAALARIRAFPFVQSARFIATGKPRKNEAPEHFQSTINSGIQAAAFIQGGFDYGAAAAQINLHNGSFLHGIGLQGQGMIVSLLDAGFYNHTPLRAFDSVNENGQVLGTWDFVAREQSVTEDDPHGMQCFSIIAAHIPGRFVGTAPKAGFFLFRSEDAASEYPIEELNWVCAAERADSAGSDVISSSLGYSTFNNPALNYRYNDHLNGDEAISTKGADLAARKGLLVVSAAGNEGDNSWKYILAPADGDSVLAVGAVDAAGNAAAFSSYGPTADGRIKPDVVSVGVRTVIQNTDNGIGAGNGTSFACPNMAGLATCLWQGFPEKSNMDIIDVLRRSAHRFQTPDDRTGYGIPDMKKAVQLLLADYATASVQDCKTIGWTSKDAGGMRYEIERSLRGETAFSKIGTQQASDAAFGTRTYGFTDTSLRMEDGAAQYRIRQIIDTSAAGFAEFYIDTLAVSPALACAPVPLSEGGFQILPNPVQGDFSLKIGIGAALPNLRLLLVNGIGQTVFTQQASKAEGIALIPLQATGLAPGLYYLLVFDGEKRLAVKRLLKL